MPGPFQRGPKIGRNDPCICGSGRKFKHRHGGPQYALPNLFGSAELERQIVAEGKRQLEHHKVRELQRQKQQGLGRPIISVEHKGYRFVAVGNRLHYGKWKTFLDFLHNYIKVTIGSDWGNAEIAKPLADRHPLMQWYDKLCHLQMAHAGKPGELFSTPVTGAVSAYNRLAYNLYLIAHDGKDIHTRLLARLKNKDNFQGAYYETQVAAWLIQARFELDFEDEQDTSSTHCEFTATYIPTGEKYSVEAKSRETRPGGSARTPVRVNRGQTTVSAKSIAPNPAGSQMPRTFREGRRQRDDPAAPPEGALSGTPHLGRFIWDASSGTLYLGRPIWDASSGTPHLGRLM